MITAVDTSVLLDVLGADPDFGPASKEALRTSHSDGRVIASDVVYAETASFFPSGQAARETLARMGIELDPAGIDAALAAGSAWHAYREQGGSRDRIVADFLVGAHALEQPSAC
jgi:predicted nucleic acid-binding protein